MNITVIQPHISIAKPQKNYQNIQDKIELTMQKQPHTDVIVLPELWDVGFYPKPIEDYAQPAGQKQRTFLAALAQKYKVNIVGGSFVEKQNNTIRNTCAIFNRNGEEIAAYSKSHLFSFAEENKHFTAGNETVVFEIDNIKCGVLICYDIRFPELARTLALKDIQILFLPAAWPLERVYHWNTLIRARAIENQIYLAGVNSLGHSAIINPRGEELAYCADDEEHILTADIDFSLIKEIRNTINVFRDRLPEMYIL